MLANPATNSVILDIPSGSREYFVTNPTYDRDRKPASTYYSIRGNESPGEACTLYVAHESQTKGRSRGFGAFSADKPRVRHIIRLQDGYEDPLKAGSYGSCQTTLTFDSSEVLTKAEHLVDHVLSLMRLMGIALAPTSTIPSEVLSFVLKMMNKES